MSKPTALRPEKAPSTDTGMLAASTELPADVHAKVQKAASDNDRSFAAQMRLITRQWAAGQK